MNTKPHILVLLPKKKDVAIFEKYNSKYNILVYQISPNLPLKEITNQIYMQYPKIDGVLSFTDKSSVVATTVIHEKKLAGPSPLSVFTAQYKPAFQKILQELHVSLPYALISEKNASSVRFLLPAFMKPAKGHLSKKAFLIKNHNDIERKFLDADLSHDEMTLWYQDAFRTILPQRKFELNSFIIQPYISAPQFTIDAYVFKGKVTTIGTTKSVMTPDGRSFASFEFPFQLSKTLQQQLNEVLQRMINALQFDNSFFNLEFFVENNTIIPIEFNTRMSYQFVPLFNAWYKEDFYEQALRLSLGEKPAFSKKSFPKKAVNFVLREFEDRLVEYVPSVNEIQNLENEYGLISFIPLVTAGKKLSEFSQDEYSFRYALVSIAGDSWQQINNTFNAFKLNNPIILTSISQNICNTIFLSQSK